MNREATRKRPQGVCIIPKPDLPLASAAPRMPSTTKERTKNTTGTHRGTRPNCMKAIHRIFSTARSRAISSTAPRSVTSFRNRAT